MPIAKSRYAILLYKCFTNEAQITSWFTIEANEEPDQGLVAEEEQQPDPVPDAQKDEVPFTEVEHQPDPVAEEEHQPDLVEEDEANQAVEEVEADHVVGKRNEEVSKRRHPSERVTKLKLRRNVVTLDGSGEVMIIQSL